MNRVLTHVNLARGFRGGERQTELLIRELAARQVAQRALVCRGGELAKHLGNVPGLDLQEASAPFIHRGISKRGSLLHAHEAKARHLAHLCHRLTGLPYVYTRRVDDVPGDGYFTRQSYLRAAAVVTISDAIRHKLCDYLPPLQPQVIHSAGAPATPDPEQVVRLRKAWEDKFVVGHAGALVDAHKGQSTLIEAARVLKNRIPALYVVLLGKGRDEAWLKQQAEGLQNVCFAGEVENLADFMAAFDLFAFPSRHEGLGSVLLEAMNAGLAVVASRVDGIPELVDDGATGLLVPPGDATALAAAIERLYVDAPLRQRLGAAGQARAAGFSPARMAESYLALYHRLAPELFP